jgi:hypothetical protein
VGEWRCRPGLNRITLGSRFSPRVRLCRVGPDRRSPQNAHHVLDWFRHVLGWFWWEEEMEMDQIRVDKNLTREEIELDENLYLYLSSFRCPSKL